jgi:hypothetical protein
MTMLTPILAAALLAASAPPPATLIIPPSQGTALDGHTVTLPQDLAPATILILGFSEHSADTTTAWEKTVRTSLASNHIGFYDMPFLEDAPSLIRPLIVRSIRKQVPGPVRPNFVPITSGEAAWKQLAGFTPDAANAAYILLVDRNGSVRWQTHEPLTQQRFAELADAARKLAAESR